MMMMISVTLQFFSHSTLTERNADHADLSLLSFSHDND